MLKLLRLSMKIVVKRKQREKQQKNREGIKAKISSSQGKCTPQL
jgi:hypothetical protein